MTTPKKTVPEAPETIPNPVKEDSDALERKIQKKVNQLKKDHRSIYVIRVVDTPAQPQTETTPYVPPVVKVAYLKPVDRKALSIATATGGSDPFLYNEIILRECWLDGDDEIRTDESLFLSICPKLEILIETKEAEIKKY